MVHNAYDYDWPVVEVEWVDSTASETWRDREGWEASRMIIRTVGYLFKDLSDRVVIAQSVSALDLLGQVISIPRGAIKSMVYLWDGVEA